MARHRKPGLRARQTVQETRTRGPSSKTRAKRTGRGFDPSFLKKILGEGFERNGRTFKRGRGK